MRHSDGSGLDDLFTASHVVLVGASRTPGRLGHTLAGNLLTHGFSGRVDFVNPGGGELFGRTLYPDVSLVPGDPDLAVLLVQAGAVAATIESCVDRGIRRFVLASGGFSETGDPGRALEDRIRDLVTEHGLCVVGPNCVGLIDTGSGLDTSFLAGDPVPAGHVAFVSHSGAMCASVIEWGRDDGFGFSRIVSLGNQVDVSETDAILSAAADPRTRVICVYLESISDGRRFMDVCERVTRHKPIVALKAGRSEAGQRAAASHTGALAGLDAAFEAAFQRSGIQRATSTEDLVDRVRVLARYPAARAHRIAILTNAGGPGVAAADAAATAGLEVVPLGPGSTRRLRELLPAEGSVANPIDLLASASAKLFGDSLAVLLSDPDVDAVVVLLPPPPGYPADRAAEAILEAASVQTKPVLTVLMGGPSVGIAARIMKEGGMPVFRYPEQAVRALAAVHAASMTRSRAERRAPGTGPRPGNRAVMPTAGPGGWVPSSDALTLVAELGIPVPTFGLATTASGAVAESVRCGYPVVLKADHARIVHKTDVGGVVLDLSNDVEVALAFESITAGMRDGLRRQTSDRSPASESEDLSTAGGLRVLVQSMAPPGIDLIVGLTRDPHFGWLVMAGTGGTEVESLRDVAFAVGPLTADDALALLEDTSAGRLLKPSRGRPAIDPEAVVDALVLLSHFAAARPGILEVEINPLRLSRDGSVLALDARLRLG